MPGPSGTWCCTSWDPTETRQDQRSISTLEAACSQGALRRAGTSKPFKDKVLHVTGAIFGQHKHSVPRDSWDDDARLLSEASSTDPAHLAAFEGGVAWRLCKAMMASHMLCPLHPCALRGPAADQGSVRVWVGPRV